MLASEATRLFIKIKKNQTTQMKNTQEQTR